MPFYDLDAEMSVIGAMLQDPDALKLCGTLSPDDFYNPQLRDIYRAVAALHARHDPVDLQTVDAQLTKDLGEHMTPDLTQLMVRTTQVTPTSANARAYVDIVKEQSDRRALMRIGSEMQRMAQDRTADIAVTMDDARQAMRNLSRGVSDWVGVGGVLMDTYGALERRMAGQERPISSGIGPLDRVFYGFVPGELTVVGARPGVGKSAFAGSIAVNAAMHGAKVGIVSLEMSRIQYGQRLIASSSLVDSAKIRAANVEEPELARVVDAIGELSSLPIEFMFKCRTIERLSVAVQQRVDERHLDLLIIDYLQLLRSERKFKSDYERVTHISQALKEMSAVLEIPIIALAQLSRANMARADKRPILSDLRDSGSIEQDADNVIFLHRPDSRNDMGVNDKDKNTFDGYVERGYHYLHISIEKQRQGQIGSGNLLFDPRYMRYTAIERRAAQWAV